MALKATGPAINGPGQRACESWIDRFIEYTEGLESAVIFRRWAAIAMIAATLEQKVWVNLSTPLYPNLYTFLIGQPGIGKSRAIMAASALAREALPEMFFGSTSMTRASLTDHMNEAKRFIANIPFAPIEYHSLVIVADEFSVLMDQYDTALVASFVEFYDCNPYSEGRRVANIRIKVQRPQLNMLSGSTPSNLLHTLKEHVWDQGLMSRVIMVYSDDRPLIDVFEAKPLEKPKELLHDLKLINTIMGEFTYTPAFRDVMNKWRLLGLAPVPSHPKLKHYCTRRWAHLLKLCMVSCIDRDGKLVLDRIDFNRAMNWLVEAENSMPQIFQIGTSSSDSRVMDEIRYFVAQRNGGISEHHVINFARTKLQSYAIRPLLEAMQASRQIIVKGVDKKGFRIFIIPDQDTTP
jgi:hypothetical protein